MTERGKAFSVLAMNTLAFTVCFAVWMMNGVTMPMSARQMEDRARDGGAGRKSPNPARGEA